MSNDSQNTRKFNLDKGGKRSFNLEKKATRVFDLSKDTPESPVTSSASAGSAAQSSADNGGGKKRVWWIVLLIGVFALLVYFFVSGGNTETAPVAEDKTEVKSDAEASDKSVAGNADEVSPGVAPSAESQQSEADAGSDAGTQPPVAEVPAVQQQSEPAEPVAEMPATEAENQEDVEEQARQVIRGRFGNNPERRRRLGADYAVIQKRVNEMMRR